MSSIEATASPSSDSESFTIPWRRDRPIHAPGEIATISFSFQNCGDCPSQISFYSTELVGDAGHTIPSYQIAFDPRSQVLAPGATGTVRVEVTVPTQALPGCYSALVQTVGLEATKAVISIEVR